MSDSVQFHLKRARMLQEEGDVEGAIDILRGTLKVLTERVDSFDQFWSNLGGVFDAAYTAKHEFDRLNADQATVLYALGELCQNTGRNAEASQAFQKVLQLQIDSSEHHELIRKTREALRVLEHVVSSERVEAGFPEEARRRCRDVAAVLNSLAGRLCIYKEKRFVRLVRMAEIKVDDWGARFTFEIVPAQGFDPDKRSTFTASASWEILAVSGRAVYAIYVSWILVVRPDLVERIRSLAAQGKSGFELLQHINKLADGMEKG